LKVLFYVDIIHYIYAVNIQFAWMYQ